MESIQYHGIAMGGKIYSLRMAKRMSQEQLGAVLNISPAAVSKWERNLSKPSIEMLWALADLFQCSIDELVGRTTGQIEALGIYDAQKFRLALIGEDLLKCSEISRQQGLLSMEACIPDLKGESRFLAFAIPYILYLFMRQVELPAVFQLLENYVVTLPQAEREEGRMIAAVLRQIFAGEAPEMIQELISSFIGIDYRERKTNMSELLKYTRQEILDHYRDKKLYSEHTDLLESFAQIGDFEIQLILRDSDNATLTAALTGASGRVVQAFLKNLSDRMLYFIHEDMKQWNGTEEEILTAQEKLLELGNYYLQKSES